MATETESYVKACCKDILEFVPPEKSGGRRGYVKFHHRLMYDFVTSPAMADVTNAGVPSHFRVTDFSAQLALAEARLLHKKLDEDYCKVFYYTFMCALQDPWQWTRSGLAATLDKVLLEHALICPLIRITPAGKIYHRDRYNPIDITNVILLLMLMLVWRGQTGFAEEVIRRDMAATDRGCRALNHSDLAELESLDAVDEDIGSAAKYDYVRMIGETASLTCDARPNHITPTNLVVCSCSLWPTFLRCLAVRSYHAYPEASSPGQGRSGERAQDWETVDFHAAELFLLQGARLDFFVCTATTRCEMQSGEQIHEFLRVEDLLFTYIHPRCHGKLRGSLQKSRRWAEEDH
jgi:hypothetical protein